MIGVDAICHPQILAGFAIRIVAAHKARWAKLKGAKPAVKAAIAVVKQVVAGKVTPPAKKKFTMSAEAKAKISAAAKLRWAKVRAAKK